MNDKACQFPPLSHLELWDLFQNSLSGTLGTQATIRIVTEGDMFAMFRYKINAYDCIPTRYIYTYILAYMHTYTYSCSTLDALQKIIFQTILQVKVDPVKAFAWKFWQSIVFLQDFELDQLEEQIKVLVHAYEKSFENGER